MITAKGLGALLTYDHCYDGSRDVVKESEAGLLVELPAVVARHPQD